MTARQRLLEWLSSGGDDRITQNLTSGLNAYGYDSEPHPDEIFLSSSTASSISASAFEFLRKYQSCIEVEIDAKNMEDVYAEYLHETRQKLARLLGIGGGGNGRVADIVMTTSGTDAHLIAITLISRKNKLKLTAITLAGSETGSAVGTASAGRHFSTHISGNVLVKRGEPLDPSVEIENISFTPRSPQGCVRTDSEIEKELNDYIENAIMQDRHCVLTVADISKTGLIAPSLEVVMRLKDHFGSDLDILIDACQFRISPSTIQAYLRCNFIVAVTGSKFIGGPIFSAALLIPRLPASRFRYVSLPPSIGNYCTSAEWPNDWKAQESLSPRPNFGLLLRWQAALFELERFLSIPMSQIEEVMNSFNRTVRECITKNSTFELVEMPKLCRNVLSIQRDETQWPDTLPTVFPILLKNSLTHENPQSFLSADETMIVYNNLTKQRCGMTPIRVGQPTYIGSRNGNRLSAIRICLSMPKISDAISSRNGKGALEKEIHEAFERIECEIHAAKHN